MFGPRKEIVTNREKIHTWTEKMMDFIIDYKQIEEVFEFLDKYKCETHFPLVDIPFYEELIEGWKLVAYRNKLETEYPSIYKQVLVEEQKQRREMLKMMKEDDKTKW